MHAQSIWTAQVTHERTAADSMLPESDNGTTCTHPTSTPTFALILAEKLLPFILGISNMSFICKNKCMEGN